jgi:catechol 2,3-dioxygenase-like lactoylglutathione lyase family enzyme
MRNDQTMTQHIALITLVVRDYDEAVKFYLELLGFELMEDTPLRRR